MGDPPAKAGAPAPPALQLFNPASAFGSKPLRDSLVGGDIANVQRTEGVYGTDYGIDKDKYQLAKILKSTADKRNPYREDVTGDLHITKYTTEMSDFSDRDYYMMVNDFQAGTDSETYVLSFMKALGSHRMKWDREYQLKKAELTAEHYTESEASRIASDYVDGLKQVDLSILHTRYPKATIEKAREKMWMKPSIHIDRP